MLSVHSDSPNNSPKCHGSHRHVGEGALDDSDSSESNHAVREAGEGGEASSDEESGLMPLISPYLSARVVVPATPSPLSHVAVQRQWTEDEEEGYGDGDEASPSPGSTDTDSSSSSSSGSDGGEGSVRRKKKSLSLSRRTSRSKSHSRSLTVASLAVSSMLQQVRKLPLVHHESKGSIRTVSGGDPEQDVREESVVDMAATAAAAGKHDKQFSPESRKTHRSHAVSMELVVNAAVEEVEPKVVESPKRGERMSDKRRLRIVAEEAKFRQMGWDTLRDMFGRFSDKGEVQMCAMLSVVATKELRVEKWRIARFLESYLSLFSSVIFYEPIWD
jgi:WD repeat-containing protein 24